MKIVKINIICLLLATLVITTITNAHGYTLSDSVNFRIVGYYSMQNAMSANLDSFPFQKLTHINLYFLNPDSAGNFSQPFSRLRPFIQKAHSFGVKILPSISGGGPHPYYHKLLEDPLRKKLTRDLVELVCANNFDGLDVDLEGGDIDSNYTVFVTGLAKSLHDKNKIITAAIAVFYKDVLPDAALSQYDFVNVMSYDHTGPWRPEVPGPHATYDQAVADLDYFLTERHIPKNKVTLGLPFYGYGFGPEKKSAPVSMNYRDIIGSFPGAAEKDSLELSSGATLYYNGLPTIKKKVELAREKASGVMIWQISADAAGENSLLDAIRSIANVK